MQERELRYVNIYRSPNPFDLIKASTGIVDREIKPPPKTYVPATNPEGQIKDITANLIEVFGDHLLFVGLTGSRAVSTIEEGQDLDVIVIVDDEATEKEVPPDGDIKIVSYTGLKAYIECGFQFITNQFRKARPLFERGEILSELKSFRLIPERAIPFLIARAKFTDQTADVLKLMSDKYRAIFLIEQGFEREGFEQLRGIEHDELFGQLQERDLNTLKGGVYAMSAKYYANVGLNRMFQSSSEMLQALHVKERDSIADVEELIEWGMQMVPEPGVLLKYIYEMRIACYKRGELLLHSDFNRTRSALRRQNAVVHGMI